MKPRTIEMIATPSAPHFVGDGFRVHNFIPSYPRMDMKRMDPFIMLDYNAKFEFPPSERPKGVSVHPHRGFETVTIAYHGKVEHHDSSGGGGIIGEGDVQWMTAASGVLHKEYHETQWSKKGGVFQMVQLWVNLPAKDKMSRPKYQSIVNSEMAKVGLADNAGTVEVIAGEYKGIKGSADTFSPLHIYNARLNKGGKAEFQLPPDFNTALLIIEGEILLNETETVAADNLALMANDGEDFTVEATENAVVLVLSGAPLNEPIAAHGPFVMNTHQELVEAFNDFNTGKFGYLED
ncbi:pirin family protein [Galbibacter pacificus]|uniref:Pirin family protein n=1 Tax=Galbibacter pacificus TaxID=2996052 RepID=A0ABT6FNP6_9FLAO|nr:pirin family protein [Galbibacter pacificus]MDG3581243.1 pirin family protein [Galbibacter pacificus]MDG3584721.1 pirin family protein [Galbibacter pacificus]